MALLKLNPYIYQYFFLGDSLTFNLDCRKIEDCMSSSLNKLFLSKEGPFNERI
jgi:hypothetical protein